MAALIKFKESLEEASPSACQNIGYDQGAGRLQVCMCGEIASGDGERRAKGLR
jgi:hypothetical protein